MTTSNSNVFQDVLTNASEVEERLLGPTYPYYKNIKSPSEIGMSDKGTIQQMSKNVNGLIEYVSLLVSGKSKASATGNPLGNKFFLNTGGKCSAVDKCTDASGCELVDRYIYIDNVPAGNVPFISSGMGVNFKEFRGLIPGTMSNLNALNPFAIMRSFMSGANPPCQSLTMATLDSNNVKSSETHYVTVADITSMDPCSFTDKKNPVTNQKCKEAFTGLGSMNNIGYGNVNNYNDVYNMPDDAVIQTYFACLSVLGVYVLYRIMDKSK